MTLSTKRQREVAKAVTLIIPGASFADAEPIRQEALKRAYKTLPPSTAVWLATVSHIRHVHTDYETLLKEGYERDAARHFVMDAINARLTDWRASRFIDARDDLDDE